MIWHNFNDHIADDQILFSRYEQIPWIYYTESLIFRCIRILRHPGGENDGHRLGK